MEVNKTRYCLVTDILLNTVSENRLNAFENGETQFNSGGVVK